MQKKIAFLCVFVMAYTLYFIDLPPWWDGTTTAVTALDTVKNNINLYVDFFGKPPFIFLSLGTLFKIFGYSPGMLHVFMMVFSIAALIFIFIAASLLSTILINDTAEKKSNKLRTALAAQLIPVIVFIGWAYGNYTRKGWFLFPRDSPIMNLDSIFNENLIMRSEQLLVINYNWILTILIICSILIWFYRQRESFDPEKIKMLLPLILFFFLFFITVAPIRDFNLPRYVIVLYPAFYLASAWGISVLSGKNKNC